LSGNLFITLPGEIGLLENLTLFDLSGNQLQTLPDEFPDMFRMLDLDLGNNKLEMLPSTFGRMSRLVNLNLSDNKLIDLPVSIGNCKVLNSIYIDRNPIQDKEMITKYNINIDHFKNYLEKRYFLQEQQDKYDRKHNTNKEKKPRANRSKKEEIVEEEDEDWEEVKEEDEDAGLSDAEKHAKIRGHSQKLATEVKNELVTLKRFLNSATTSDIIILIAKAIRELIPFMNAARQQMAAIPKPNPPVVKPSDDDVTRLRKTVAVAMREFETVHQNVLFVVCGNPTIEQLVSLSNVITGSLQILQDCVQECKDLGAK